MKCAMSNVVQQQGAAARSRDLSRDKVIRAGLDLMDRGGAAAVTMRSVGESLGVSPMALYNHVSSKHDLMRAIAAHVLDSTEFSAGATDWRGQVTHCARVLRALCLRHPGLARLLEMADMAPASVVKPMEVTLRALRKAGMSQTDGLRTYFTLVGFILVQASYQCRGPYPGLEPSACIRSEPVAGRGCEMPEEADLPRQWDFDAAFEFGLQLILDGVEAAVRRAKARPVDKIGEDNT